MKLSKIGSLFCIFWNMINKAKTHLSQFRYFLELYLILKHLRNKVLFDGYLGSHHRNYKAGEALVFMNMK